jgi:hypothetical protein
MMASATCCASKEVVTVKSNTAVDIAKSVFVLSEIGIGAMFWFHGGEIMNSVAKMQDSGQPPLGFQEVSNLPNTLGLDNFPDIVKAARGSDAYFADHYKGRPFLAQGTYNSINTDMGTYNISVSLGADAYSTNDVNCRTTDDSVVAYTNKLRPGTSVEIVGQIGDTWMGDVQLDRCQIAVQQ